MERRMDSLARTSSMCVENTVPNFRPSRLYGLGGWVLLVMVRSFAYVTHEACLGDHRHALTGATNRPPQNAP